MLHVGDGFIIGARCLVARICVVDDDKVTRDAVGKLLRFAGYEVVVYEDAQPALDAEGQFEGIDLVLTDSSMPTPAGDLLTAFGRDRIEVPGVVMSGNFRETDRDLYRRLGAKALIDKPLGLDGLKETISAILGSD